MELVEPLKKKKFNDLIAILTRVEYELKAERYKNKSDRFETTK